MGKTHSKLVEPLSSSLLKMLSFQTMKGKIANHFCSQPRILDACKNYHAGPDLASIWSSILFPVLPILNPSRKGWKIKNQNQQ